ncbi:MAG: DotU family type IV/VI secretion system protein, partial [Planctomycetota bacterium]
DGVLRVFHDCVLLGFQGVYSLGVESVALTERGGIPPTSARWIEETRRHLERGDSVATNGGRHRTLKGAPPSTSRRQLVWWALAASVLFVINVTVFSLASFS